jgi:hypothetical protein
MFLSKIDLPEEERDEVINKIMTRRFSEMFTLIDGYSVQETRKAAAEAAAEAATKAASKGFALKLLKRGRPTEEIVEDTGLTRKEVEDLREAD